MLSICRKACPYILLLVGLFLCWRLASGHEISGAQDLAVKRIEAATIPAQPGAFLDGSELSGEDLAVEWPENEVCLLQADIHVKQRDISAQSRTNASTRETPESRDLTRREWISIIFWTSIITCCVAFHFLVPDDEKESSSTAQREVGWDMAKLLFMWTVLIQHVNGFWGTGNTIIQDTMGVVCMPGFSMVSGMFATSLAIRDTSTGKVSLGMAQLQRFFCDLILVNVTIFPWCLLLRSESFADMLGRLARRPLIMAPDMWYLGTLWLWLLLTPLLVSIPLPMMTTLFVYLFVGINHKAAGGEINDFIANPSINLLPFFVFGFFVLGGGGLSQDGRKERKQNVQAWLKDGRVRILAIVVLAAAAWIAYDTFSFSGSGCWKKDRCFNVYLQSMGVFKLAASWSQGGMLTDGLSLVFSTVASLALIVVAFMIPPRPFLCQAGSHTLYAYVLQEVYGKAMVLDPGLASAFTLLWPSLGSMLETQLIVFLAALVVTLTLSSKFVVMLTKPFVQPRWAIPLMEHIQSVITSGADKSIF